MTFQRVTNLTATAVASNAVCVFTLNRSFYSSISSTPNARADSSS